MSLLLFLLLDDLLSFCSFLSSHPLHLAYLLFFFPYLFSLLSFLSPLLLSTSLLLLSLLTVSPDPNDPLPNSSKLLGNVCAALLDILKAKLEADGTIDLVEQLSSIVLAPVDDDAIASFQEPIDHAFLGNGSETESEATGESSCEYLSLASDAGESSTEIALENAQEGELLVPNYAVHEDQTTDRVAENASKASDIDSKKPAGMIELPPDNAGENLINSASRPRKDHAPRASESLQRDGPMGNDNASNALDSLQRDGSMRKEKEWKRTLACKLYEERMTFKLCEERTVVEGCEEMDLLWEAYEADAIKSDKSFREKGKKKTEEKEKTEEHKEEEEYEEETTGEFCCLQALRLSAGKMNLGVGRPNLAKISKALKGMGLFQRVGSRRSRRG